MTQGALTLFRLAGISVRVHYTWFFAFFLIAWSLPRNLFPVGNPGWTDLTYWVVGSSAALLIFGSVLFHEFAHSFMALARGMKVDSITLFIFGGAAVLKSEPRRPSDEFFIAVVGPASSLLLAVTFLILSVILPLDLPAQTPHHATGLHKRRTSHIQLAPRLSPGRRQSIPLHRLGYYR